MNRIFTIVTIILAALQIGIAQTPQSLAVIDGPTAGTLDRGSFLTALYAYNDGGLLGNLSVGITDRIMFGISYGGTNIIGTGPVKWNPQVGVNVRYRAMDETTALPAISVGYDGQGMGAYQVELKRYLEKSKGAYVALSKSFKFLGLLVFHGGVNYSFERNDGDKDLDGYVGIEKSVNDELSLFGEYDLAMNDNTGRSLGDGKGYLNAAVKWTFQNKLHIDFLWKNILRNNALRPYSSREIRLSYIEYF